MYVFPWVMFIARMADGIFEKCHKQQALPCCSNRLSTDCIQGGINVSLKNSHNLRTTTIYLINIFPGKKWNQNIIPQPILLDTIYKAT